MESIKMHKRDLTGILISATILAAFVIMLNPEVMERISDAFFRSIMTFLKALDRFTVNYQLQRGIWDGKMDETVPEAEMGSEE